MAEQTFFSSGSVTVTQARFVVDGQTYAMQGVTSVRRELAQPSKKGPIIAVLFGVIAVFVSFALFSSSIGTGIVLLLIGVGIIAAGVLVPGSKSYPLRDFELRVGGIKGSLEQG